jgi:hypothetical protein
MLSARLGGYHHPTLLQPELYGPNDTEKYEGTLSGSKRSSYREHHAPTPLSNHWMRSPKRHLKPEMRSRTVLWQPLRSVSSHQDCFVAGFLAPPGHMEQIYTGAAEAGIDLHGQDGGVCICLDVDHPRQAALPKRCEDVTYQLRRLNETRNMAVFQVPGQKRGVSLLEQPIAALR